MGNNVLAPGYSNYQLFKATLQYIASRDLVKNPLVCNADSSVATGGDIPVLMDGQHGLNLFFKMSPWSYKMVITSSPIHGI